MGNKILVTYFSHEGESYVNGKMIDLEIGNTRVAAEMIQKRTNGDILRIETVNPYPYDHMETVRIAQEEQEKNARPVLKNTAPALDQYDTIVLSYPNWWGTMPMAVFTFLESGDFFGKRILPLCTHEGSGMGDSEADIQALCPGAKVEKGLAVVGGKVSKSEKEIQKWLHVMGL